MRVLITGCGGFIGSHLATRLIGKAEIFGTVYDFDGTRNIEKIKDRMTVLKCDMSDKESVEAAVEKSKPDMVFHLAAQSFVVPSWQDPEKTFRTNFLGTYYLLEALRKTMPNAKILVACSSAEYGFITEDDIPLREDSQLRPSSPYAVSKIGQDMISYLYAKAYGMKIIRMRLFNTTGPGKTFDACSDFAKGIADIENGKRKELVVGNLEGMRDITDVRDTVRAMILLSEHGEDGEVYNICTGKAHKIGDLLEKLRKMSKTKIDIRVSPDTNRRIDDPLFIGDNKKLSGLGWKPEIAIEKTLEDTLDYWRKFQKTY